MHPLVHWSDWATIQAGIAPAFTTLYQYHYPRSNLRVRYETLMSDPTTAIERLLEFLRIDSSPDTVAGCVQRVNFAACTPGDWPHRFDAEAAFRFDAVAGYLLQQLGYSEPTSTGLRRAA